jgi:hypothetical protein
MSDISPTTDQIATPDNDGAQGADQAPPLDWRKHLPVHPAAELFPLMSEAELTELAADIEKNGTSTRIALWADSSGKKWLLDGRNRLDALALLGLLTTEKGSLALKARPHDHPFEFECWHSDPYALALSFNVHRRHLTAEQKHRLISEVLKVRTELSDRQIGRMTKSDKNTVAADRAKLEARGEIHHVAKRTDTKGRKQPATKDSPGFDAASERAQRLGREVRRFGDGYQLTDPEDGGGPAYFASLSKLDQQLKEISDSSRPPKVSVKGGGTQSESPIAAADLDRSAEEIEEHNRAALVIYAGSGLDLAEKITEFADLNVTVEAKEMIHRAACAWAKLDGLVNGNGTPSGSGPAPEGETDEDTEAPAEMTSTSTVSAVEEPGASPIDRSLDIPDNLIQAARQRHPIASAPQDTPAPAPVTPPTPSPSPPSPAPAPVTPTTPPPTPTPKLNECTKVLPHYQPAHRDPQPVARRA